MTPTSNNSDDHRSKKIEEVTVFFEEESALTECRKKVGNIVLVTVQGTWKNLGERFLHQYPQNASNLPEQLITYKTGPSEGLLTSDDAFLTKKITKLSISTPSTAPQDEFNVSKVKKIKAIQIRIVSKPKSESDTTESRRNSKRNDIFLQSKRYKRRAPDKEQFSSCSSSSSSSSNCSSNSSDNMATTFSTYSYTIGTKSTMPEEEASILPRLEENKVNRTSSSSDTSVSHKSPSSQSSSPKENAEELYSKPMPTRNGKEKSPSSNSSPSSSSSLSSSKSSNSQKPPGDEEKDETLPSTDKSNSIKKFLTLQPKSKPLNETKKPKRTFSLKPKPSPGPKLQLSTKRRKSEVVVPELDKAYTLPKKKKKKKHYDSSDSSDPETKYIELSERTQTPGVDDETYSHTKSLASLSSLSTSSIIPVDEKPKKKKRRTLPRGKVNISRQPSFGTLKIKNPIVRRSKKNVESESSSSDDDKRSLSTDKYKNSKSSSSHKSPESGDSVKLKKESKPSRTSSDSSDEKPKKRRIPIRIIKIVRQPSSGSLKIKSPFAPKASKEDREIRDKSDESKASSHSVNSSKKEESTKSRSHSFSRSEKLGSKHSSSSGSEEKPAKKATLPKRKIKISRQPSYGTLKLKSPFIRRSKKKDKRESSDEDTQEKVSKVSKSLFSDSVEQVALQQKSMTSSSSSSSSSESKHLTKKEKPEQKNKDDKQEVSSSLSKEQTFSDVNDEPLKSKPTELTKKESSTPSSSSSSKFSKSSPSSLSPSPSLKPSKPLVIEPADLSLSSSSSISAKKRTFPKFGTIKLGSPFKKKKPKKEIPASDTDTHSSKSSPSIHVKKELSSHSSSSSTSIKPSKEAKSPISESHVSTSSSSPEKSAKKRTLPRFGTLKLGSPFKKKDKRNSDDSVSSENNEKKKKSKSPTKLWKNFTKAVVVLKSPKKKPKKDIDTSSTSSSKSSITKKSTPDITYPKNSLSVKTISNSITASQKAGEKHSASSKSASKRSTLSTSSFEKVPLLSQPEDRDTSTKNDISKNSIPGIKISKADKNSGKTSSTSTSISSTEKPSEPVKLLNIDKSLSSCSSQSGPENFKAKGKWRESPIIDDRDLYNKWVPSPEPVSEKINKFESSKSSTSSTSTSYYSRSNRPPNPEPPSETTQSHSNSKKSTRSHNSSKKTSQSRSSIKEDGSLSISSLEAVDLNAPCTTVNTTNSKTKTFKTPSYEIILLANAEPPLEITESHTNSKKSTQSHRSSKKTSQSRSSIKEGGSPSIGSLEAVDFRRSMYFRE